jgi:transient receptor potential cation channel subfamily V member 5
MGNTTSDVTNNVKAQADAQENPPYKLLDIKGGGELIKLMKEANLNKDYSNLNERLREMIVGMLYNEGNGKNVILKCLLNLIAFLKSFLKDSYRPTCTQTWWS